MSRSGNCYLHHQSTLCGILGKDEDIRRSTALCMVMSNSQSHEQFLRAAVMCATSQQQHIRCFLRCGDRRVALVACAFHVTVIWCLASAQNVKYAKCSVLIIKAQHMSRLVKKKYKTSALK